MPLPRLGLADEEGIRGRRLLGPTLSSEQAEPCLLGTGTVLVSQPRAGLLRKEVIQPQVPLRLPCYDFTPVADLTVVGCLPCGLAHRLRVKPTPMV